MKNLINKLLLSIFIMGTILAPIITSQAQSSKPSGTSTTLQDFNPIKSGGIKCLYSYSKTDSGVQGCNSNTGLFNRIEQLLFLLAPAFAVLGVMFGGYKMMLDGYDSKGEGMKTIRGAILGLIIVLSAFFVRNIVYSIFNDTFTADSVTINNNSVQIIVNILRTISYQFLIPIGSPIAVGFVIWGGYQLVTAGGNQKKIDAGIATIRNAIIGFLVIIFAAALVSISQNLLAGFYGTIPTK